MMKDKLPLKWPRRVICLVGALIYFVGALALGSDSIGFFVFLVMGVVLLIGAFI